ncbi:MAG: DNA (cytosine-5-)-methyltransferase [Melioribacteraceae bacterium]|nr:DNA (cytosine-5-)-methyltransferase [Melioribacteraceae bacterium]
MKDKFTVGSLFAGIGGICLAFKQAGAQISWANEYDSKACATYRENFPDTNLFEEDVVNLHSKKLKKIDIITAGFPCQAFSIAGYREGFKDKKGRGNLFFDVAKLIEKLKPKAYFLENVKNLAGHDSGRTLKIIRDTLKKDLKYSFIPFILNSKDYGNIPQTRERIYIVGFRNESEYEIDDLNRDYDNNKICTWNFQIPDPIKLTKKIHDLIQHDSVPENFYYQEKHIYYNQLKREINNKNTVYQWRRVYVRENKNNICPTLTANMGTGGHNVPLIIDNFGIRKLTPKECLNFQGFPEDYNFPEDLALSHCYKQAGNSVVVPVVKRIADEIIRVFKAKYFL